MAAGARHLRDVCVTTGALNAAAQYTWLGLSDTLSMGATGSAMMYASAWSLGTIAAASYGDVCRTYASDGGIGGEELGLARGCFAPPAGERARGLVTRLCDEEEKVGAFVAGFVWNTAMMLWIGFENEQVQVDAGAGHHHVHGGGEPLRGARRGGGGGRGGRRRGVVRLAHARCICDMTR